MVCGRKQLVRQLGAGVLIKVVLFFNYANKTPNSDRPMPRFRVICDRVFRKFCFAADVADVSDAAARRLHNGML